jgi:hypothetical protein
LSVSESGFLSIRAAIAPLHAPFDENLRPLTGGLTLV